MTQFRDDTGDALRLIWLCMAVVVLAGVGMVAFALAEESAYVKKCSAVGGVTVRYQGKLHCADLKELKDAP